MNGRARGTWHSNANAPAVIYLGTFGRDDGHRRAADIAGAHAAYVQIKSVGHDLRWEECIVSMWADLALE